MIAQELSTSCQEPCFSVIASERYALASSIAASALQQSEIKSTFSDKLEWLTTHRVLGYFTSVGVIAGLLLWTFFVGNGLSNLISSGLSFIKPVDPALSASQPILAIILNGVWGGFNAGLTLIIPFVIPFYLLLALVEDSGILTRVAFMMDSAMHKMGLHGKALNSDNFGLRLQRASDSRMQNHGNPTRAAAGSVRHHVCALFGKNNRALRHGGLVRRRPMGAAACTWLILQ